MFNFKPVGFLVGMVMVVALAACAGNPFAGAAGPVAPCSVTPSKAAGDQLLQQLQSQSSAPGSPISISATNEQITSLLNQSIAQIQQEQPGAFIPIENPIVCLESGRMSMFGKLNLAGVNANALVRITPTISGGKANFKVDQIELGPVSAPAELSSQMSTLINDSFNRYLTRIQLSQIQVQPGRAVITGQVR